MKDKVEKAFSFETVRFAMIGVINTIIDFSLLNILVSAAGFDRIPANIMSASIAMLFSFLANRTLVFKSDNEKYHRQAALFIIGTLFGIYIIQTIVIYTLTELWTGPLNLVADAFDSINRELIITNSSKVVAAGFTMVWNFTFYKRVVFKK